MGMLYQRGDVWWIKYYRNGKPYRESANTNKKMVAERLLKRREGEIAEGKTPSVEFDNVTFEQLAEGFIADYRINERKSLDRANRSVNKLNEHFNGFKVTQITTPEINKYILARLDADAANATINRELSALKRMLNLGAAQSPPLVNRVPKIPMLKENNIRKGFFEHHEFLALRDALPDYLKSMVTFAYKTGCRVGEITSLKWSQVDLKEGTVRLEAGETKNNEGRTFCLDEELKQAIKKQFVEQVIGCPYVFHRAGKQIKDFRGSWHAACREAKMEGRLFHDLRRNAVRNLVRSGVQEIVAMKISGHKTRSVFDRYNIVNLDDLKLAASTQESYLNSLAAGTVLGTVAKSA